jgi:hypothetical protein
MTRFFATHAIPGGFLAWVLGAGAATPADDSAEEFRQRLERTDTRDARAFLDLGEWCEAREQPAWAAKCYRMAIALGREHEAYADATLRLAKLESERKEFRRAYARLRELAADPAQPEARTLLEAAATEATRKQRAHVEQGDARIAAGELGAARKEYAAAFALLRQDPGAADFVPSDVLLGKLARTTERFDDEHYQKVGEPVARTIERCTRCEGGFETCNACGGKGGKTETKRYLRRGMVTRFIPCEKRNRAGYYYCPSCVGLEHTTGDSKITGKEREALRTVTAKVRDRKVLDRPFAQVVAKLAGLRPNDAAARELLLDAQVMVQTCARDLGFFDGRPAAPLRDHRRCSSTSRASPSTRSTA